jgi:hypothetical protein
VRTLSRPKSSHVPYGAWPRGLTQEEAAAYVGFSPDKFAEAVRLGWFSPPVPSPWTKGAKRYDRHILDRDFDRLSNGNGNNQPEFS